MAMAEHRWGDVPASPPPVDDEWMARQVIRFHEKGDVPCAGCSQGLVCERLAQAKAIVGDGSTTDTSTTPAPGSTVRRTSPTRN